MSLGHGHARLLTLAMFTLTLGCAAQHEEAANTMPSSEAERSGDHEDRAAQSEAVAMEPASEEQSERSLDDIERELALNEAKLRELGVSLPSRLPSAPGEVDEDRAGGESNIGRGDKRGGDGVAPSGGGGRIESSKPSPPSAQPSPKPGTSSKSEQRPRDRKGKKADKPSKDKSGFAEPPPDEAKATPLGPNGSEREPDAAGRCEQVCVLSQITCELNAQICELAGRHTDEEDYEAACERAAVDCEVAQEACNECVG